MKARFRHFARGLRRRLSNLAWGLGGGSVAALLVVGVVRNMLPLRDLPNLLAVSTTLAICVSLLMTVAAFGIATFLRQSRDVIASAEATGVRVERGGRTKEYPYEKLGALLRHEDRVWVLQRNGNVMDFAFEDVEAARSFEATVREQITDGRFELVPHPTVATAAFVLVTMGGTCGVTMEMAAALSQPHLYIRSLALALAILAAATVGRALRGKLFVLGRDGIRLGSKFVAFERIDTVSVAKERVTIVDLDGETVTAKVRMPRELADALNAEFARRLGEKRTKEGVLARERGEAVHAWLKRVRTSLREAGFRNPAMQKKRIRVAAFHPKSPLRVRVAALAGLMDEEPELAKELLAVSADPRLEKAAKAAQGSVDDWRRVVEHLEREGALE